MADERVVVDPITRIEGHLRIEAEVKDKTIQKAYSSGTAVRGIELIVRDRDPRDLWAYTQRICGVCTSVHALASVRAVEDALGIRIPHNAHLIRSIMDAAVIVHDHVVHFYHLHSMDWVDVLAAAGADPNEAARIAQSYSRWPKSTAGYFKDIQDKIKKLVESGQLGIFATGYWGHPAYKLPPEVNLIMVAHYLEALDWQKEIVRIHTIFGGRNPHPNYVVGGVPWPIDPNMDNALNTSRLTEVDRQIDMALEFVEQVYLPDVLTLAKYYRDWTFGGGLKNYLAYGDFSPTSIYDVDSYRFPRGVVLDFNLNEVHDVDPRDLAQIQEFVDHSWYTYDGKPGGIGKHPWEGETTIAYEGPKTFATLNVEGKYSWVKSPRWMEKPMEVGPLARLIVGYAKKNDRIREAVDRALKEIGVDITWMHSAIGRTLARAIDASLVAHFAREDMDQLFANIRSGNLATFDNSKWDPKTWPKEAKGVGWAEVPRGALGHWVIVKDGKVERFQAVVPTTWNASPRDHKDNVGAYEASLVGAPLEDPARPVEIIRIIHSFDPCMACAVHLTDLADQRQYEVFLDM
ncbi:MAG: nickel-dependent hydrogenase large subunit [Hydrogenibacillus schlegelii]|uniref:Nickel-dependent hydrogenase large subunit n=1 Tax=Hydrogenibacillus schlegelii TaxID=1484 RepID=A0A947GBS6_HYDSH|nr:nickel-dependent hydrogenase large subunit [Hydrogenibacillus schlegelii]MBT9282710.1 nickel-dependent hydrogenase large subunit [Hydrogenibacillus schlegelii]